MFIVQRCALAIRCIDFNRLEVYEVGAFLVSLLAYPGESREDDKRRCGVYTSLRPSLPVIHLASAVHGYLHLIEIEALGLRWLLTRRDVIEHVLRNAEYCEALVGRANGLRVNADKLVRLRLR